MLKENFLMVKGSKVFFSLKYSLFLMLVLLVPLHVMAKESSSNNISNEKPSSNYKIVQKSINLAPLPTLAILGLNTYLVKKGNASYLVVISANVKKHNWLIDTIKVRRELIINQDEDFIQNIPVNLYLSENIELVVQVKQINKLNNNQKINFKEAQINLPYFIFKSNEAIVFAALWFPSFMRFFIQLCTSSYSFGWRP